MSYKRRKSGGTNKRGGTNGLNNVSVADANANANRIMNEIEQQNNLSLSNIPVVGSLVDLTEGIAVKGIDMIGDKMGIDLDNPVSIGDKLDSIKMAMNDPRNEQKVKEIVDNAGRYVDVAMPIVERAVDKTMPLVAKEATKAIRAGIATGINVAEDALGPIIGIPRTIMSAAEAANASVKAGSEVMKGTAEAIQGTFQAIKELPNEAPTNALTTNTIPTNTVQNPVQNPVQNMQYGGFKDIRNHKKIIGGRVYRSQLEFLSGYNNLKVKTKRTNKSKRRKSKKHK